jgi:hypothetical protein
MGGQPPNRLLHSVDCWHFEQRDYVKLCLDVGREELPLLVDNRADISLLKSKRLVGTTEFEPREEVRVKSVDGSIIETHGSN